MSTHNLCSEQKFEKYQNFLSENFPFLVVKFSIYLNRPVFVMLNLHTYLKCFPNQFSCICYAPNFENVGFALFVFSFIIPSIILYLVYGKCRGD